MTLIQAQQRYIDRLSSAHPGHFLRVRRSAWKQLFSWAEKRGMSGKEVCSDAYDMFRLRAVSED